MKISIPKNATVAVWCTKKWVERGVMTPSKKRSTIYRNEEGKGHENVGGRERGESRRGKRTT